MSALLRSSSRLFSRSNRRFSQTVTSEPPRETILSSSILSDQFPPSNGPPPPMPEPEVVKSSWSFLKYGIIAAFTGAAATAGYATYAYSLDKIDEKTKALCASANITIGDNAYSSDDFSMLNRDPAKVLYISGHALETSLQPENSVPIKAWLGEAADTALVDLIPFLEYVAKHPPADIRAVLASYQGHDIPKEFVERSKEHQRRMEEQKQHSRPWRQR